MNLIRYADADLPTSHGHSAWWSTGTPPTRRTTRPGRRAPGHRPRRHRRRQRRVCRVHSECWTSRGDRLAQVRLPRAARRGAGTDRRRRNRPGRVPAAEGRGIGLGTRSAPMRCRTTAPTPWRPTWRWVSRPTRAATIRPPRSWKDPGVRSIRLLTNNPLKVAGLRAAGVTVAARSPTGWARTSTTLLPGHQAPKSDTTRSAAQLRALSSARARLKLRRPQTSSSLAFFAWINAPK